MKHFFFFLLIFSCTLSACEQYEAFNPEKGGAAVCGAQDPLQELVWLRDYIEKATDPLIDNGCVLTAVTQGTYNGQTVFIMSISGALCCPCAGPPVYNCAGELVIECNVDESRKIKNKSTIWKSN